MRDAFPVIPGDDDPLYAHSRLDQSKKEIQPDPQPSPTPAEPSPTKAE